jgi:Protein  of unknown function (DUF3018)
MPEQLAILPIYRCMRQLEVTMMDKPMSRAERVERRRAILGAAGLRPVQIWVPDTRASGFAEECRRQSRLVRDSETDASRAEDEAWEIASWEAAPDDAG